jgi:DtxR family transcriptional regulator, Mn-dependent transcriptional regulator
MQCFHPACTHQKHPVIRVASAAMQAAVTAGFSASMEDYLKAIYSLTRQRETASTSDLAHRLEITAGSVSTMVKRMGNAGLVEHVPYHGVRLTQDGRQLALGVIRRHRLLELFLSTTLDIPWEDVDHHADALEHAASDELIDLIADKLGDPAADPHGDPIPDRDLEIHERATQRLADLQPGAQATIVRVSDSDPAMLRYLTQQGITIGDHLHVTARQPFDGPCEIQIRANTHSLGINLARAIRVEVS